MCHTSMGREGDIIASFDELAVREALRVSLHDLLGQRLRCRFLRVESAENIGVGVGKERWKRIGRFGALESTRCADVPRFVVEVGSERSESFCSRIGDEGVILRQSDQASSTSNAGHDERVSSKRNGAFRACRGKQKHDGQNV